MTRFWSVLHCTSNSSTPELLWNDGKEHVKCCSTAACCGSLLQFALKENSTDHQPLSPPLSVVHFPDESPGKATQPWNADCRRSACCGTGPAFTGMLSHCSPSARRGPLSKGKPLQRGKVMTLFINTRTLSPETVHRSEVAGRPLVLVLYKKRTPTRFSGMQAFVEAGPQRRHSDR